MDLPQGNDTVSARSMLKNWLRTVRAVNARAIGATVAAFPALEPPFIGAGRWLARRSPVLGTLYWFAQEDLLARLRRSGRPYRMLPIAGVDLAVDVTDATGRLHYFHAEPYEPGLSRAIADRLKPGDVFIDVGANVGYFSLLAARLVAPGGHVVAFEPDPQTVAAMRRAVEANHLTGGIDIVNAAVADTGGTTQLFLSVDSVLSTTDPDRSPARDQFAFTRSIEVSQVTLDGWLAARPELRPRIAAIKIDVEGTEADVLRGMRDTLRACPRAVVLCETSPGSPADALLRAEGYAASCLDVRHGEFGNYAYRRG